MEVRELSSALEGIENTHTQPLVRVRFPVSPSSTCVVLLGLYLVFGFLLLLSGTPPVSEHGFRRNVEQRSRAHL